MLSHMLRAAAARRVPLIASKTATFLGGGYASQSISISDLPIQAGDLIIFCTSTESATSISMSTTGYTLIQNGSDPGDDLFANNFYKVATSLESSINFSWSPGTGANISCVVAVFRGYQYNSQGGVFNENNTADPPSISCSVGDLIIASYHFLGGTATFPSSPSGYTVVSRVTANSNTSVNLFYKIATSTTENPSALSVFSGNDSSFGGTIRCTPS